MRLELEESAVDYLASKGFDPVYGARPVKRAVQRELETALAKGMLREEFGEEDVISVSATMDDGLKLTRHGAERALNGVTQSVTSNS